MCEPLTMNLINKKIVNVSNILDTIGSFSSSQYHTNTLSRNAILRCSNSRRMLSDKYVAQTSHINPCKLLRKFSTREITEGETGFHKVVKSKNNSQLTPLVLISDLQSKKDNFQIKILKLYANDYSIYPRIFGKTINTSYLEDAILRNMLPTYISRNHGFTSCYQQGSNCGVLFNSTLKISRMQSLQLKNSIRMLSYSSGRYKSTGVPDYLIGCITEVGSSELLLSEDLEDIENEMEEIITEFLSCRLIPFEETESSFSVQCPTCSSSATSSDETEHDQDMFVDKHTGYFVCPSCFGAGPWEDLCKVLDSRQDTLTLEQLTSVINDTQPVTALSAPVLSSTVFKKLSLKTLERYACRMSNDGSRLIVPVFRIKQPSSTDDTSAADANTGNNSNQGTMFNTVGYYSISLLDSEAQIVSRFVKGQITAWSSCLCSSDNNTESISTREPHKIIAVSNIVEALQLSQIGLPVINVPGNVEDWQEVQTRRRTVNAHVSTLCANTSANSDSIRSPTGRKRVWPDVWGLLPSVKCVVLWLTESNTLPYRFFTHLSLSNISCCAVSPAGTAPLYELSERDISAKLAGKLLPITETIKSFTSLQDKVYDRVIRKDEVKGVEFRRYPELQKLLLGHRRGEVTVLSGPTGSGKTTFASEYSLDLAIQGVVTLWVSLEVSLERLCEVLMQQYSGSPLPAHKTLFYALAQDFQELPLYFLDLHGQQDISRVMKVLFQSVVQRGVRHVIVDNLQFLVGCQDTSMERWMQQDSAMAQFRSFATQHNCHVTLIVHPRKLKEGELLTIQSVGGGARVTQEADNILLLQVTTGSSPTNTRKAIQVVKNRYGGYLGVAPLKFHAESLTFSNYFKRSKEQTKKISKTELFRQT
uniref:Twinkle protein n=1 Tax=Hirondellea gigas TaxID=1518452 RepID=A0A6A7FTT0_9CRUS